MKHFISMTQRCNHHYEEHSARGKGDTGFWGIKANRNQKKIPHSLYYLYEKWKKTMPKQELI